MTTKARTVRLRQILESHRNRLLDEIAGSLRHVQNETRDLHTSDILDRGERVREEDVEHAVLGIKTETVLRMDEALQRLGAGAYGLCSECGQEISDQRLLALPFAIRCRDCEEHAEVTECWQAPPRGPVLFDESYV